MSFNSDQFWVALLYIVNIDVSDLKNIIEALNKGYFPNDRWSPLGLQLGLLQPTLSAIRAKHRGDPENCLQDCLTRWLSKADIVTKSGGPTWNSLASALEKIGEVSTAEKINEFSEWICIYLSSDLSELCSLLISFLGVLTAPACQILQKHCDKLSPLNLPVKISEMLCKERVICKETLDEVNRLGGILTDGPLKALCTTLSEQPIKLKEFASVLLKSEQTIPIAKDILKEYGKYVFYND